SIPNWNLGFVFRDPLLSVLSNPSPCGTPIIGRPTPLTAQAQTGSCASSFWPPASSWQLPLAHSCASQRFLTCALMSIWRAASILFGSNLLCDSLVPATLPTNCSSAFLPHAVPSLDDTGFIHFGP